MSKLSDHVKVTIHHDGEATGDIDLDEFMAKVSKQIFELLKNSDKLDRGAAEALFADWMGKYLVDCISDLSDESFKELLMMFVEQFAGNVLHGYICESCSESYKPRGQGTSHRQLCSGCAFDLEFG